MRKCIGHAYCIPLILVVCRYLVDTLSTDEHGAEVARVTAPEQTKLAAHAGEAQPALWHWGWQALGKTNVTDFCKWFAKCSPPARPWWGQSWCGGPRPRWDWAFLLLPPRNSHLLPPPSSPPWQWQPRAPPPRCQTPRPPAVSKHVKQVKLCSGKTSSRHQDHLVKVEQLTHGQEVGLDQLSRGRTLFLLQQSRVTCQSTL